MPVYIMTYSLLNTKVIKAEDEASARSQLVDMTDSELAEDCDLQIGSVGLYENE